MADKQTALVNSIADGVHKQLSPEFAKMTELLARQAVSLAALLARVELLESTINAGATGAKKTVRTAGAAAGGKAGAKKAVAGKKAAGSETERVTNALLAFRYFMANNINDAQEIYGTEENLIQAESDTTVGKRDKEKDPAGYWSAVGAALWKTVLTDEQKDEIRTQFTAWKEDNARDDAEPQLDEEA